jgi:hypothetical protein
MTFQQFIVNFFDLRITKGQLLFYAVILLLIGFVYLIKWEIDIIQCILNYGFDEVCL